MIRALFFDLDGTLLDTIEGIRLSINEALAKLGYPYSFDREGTKALIGNGADALIRRALKEKSGDVDAFSSLKKEYMPLYSSYQEKHCSPFPGLKETLFALKEKGLDLYVVTNKPESIAIRVLNAQFGKGFFKGIYGQKDGVPVKPDPYYVNLVAKQEKYQKEEMLFVGDSLPDVETGRNAGIKTCLCTWGYGFYDKDLLKKATYLASLPSHLICIAG